MEFAESTYYVCQYSNKGKILFFVFSSGIPDEFYVEVYYSSNILCDIILIGVTTTKSIDFSVVKESVEYLLSLETCKHIINSIEDGSQQIVTKNRMDMNNITINKFSLN